MLQGTKFTKVYQNFTNEKEANILKGFLALVTYLGHHIQSSLCTGSLHRSRHLHIHHRMNREVWDRLLLHRYHLGFHPGYLLQWYHLGCLHLGRHLGCPHLEHHLSLRTMVCLNRMGSLWRRDYRALQSRHWWYQGHRMGSKGWPQVCYHRTEIILKQIF